MEIKNWVAHAYHGEEVLALGRALESRRYSPRSHDLRPLSPRQPAILKSLADLGVQVLLEGKRNWTQAKWSNGWKPSGSSVFWPLSSPSPDMPSYLHINDGAGQRSVLTGSSSEVKQAADKGSTSEYRFPPSLISSCTLATPGPTWAWGSFETVFSLAHTHFHWLLIILEEEAMQTIQN